MSKKSVTRDEIGFKGGGLYCITPFSSKDTSGSSTSPKMLIKAGLSKNLAMRMTSYGTDFPLGVVMLCLCEVSTINPASGKKKTDTYLRYLEQQLFQKLLHPHLFGLKFDPAIRIHSTDRVREINEHHEGASEWFFCNVALCVAACQSFNDGDFRVFKKFSFDPPETDAQIAREMKSKRGVYVAKIVYPLKTPTVSDQYREAALSLHVKRDGSYSFK